ncbi:MAG: cytochrome c [Lentimicrobiaceae bacterium]|jgi:hypothetical protein
MRTRLKILFLTAFSLSLALSGCYDDNEEDLYLGSKTCDTSNVTYAATVAPIFATYCNSCHSGGSPSGNIVTNSFASVKANIIRIRGAINQQPGFSAMPKNGVKLSSCELSKVDVWINQGMPNN